MNLFPQKIQDKFTSHLKGVIAYAEAVSKEFNHEYIGVEHIIYGLVSQKGSLSSNVLVADKIDLKNLKEIIIKIPTAKKWEAKLSDDLKDIFKKAVLVASKYKHSYIGTEHLLYAILLSKNSKTAEIFFSIGIKSENLKKQLKALLESSSRFSDITDFFDQSVKFSKLSVGGLMPNANPNGGFMIEMPGAGPAFSGKQSALECFSVDLIKEYETGNIDPIIGREKEISKVINILNRKSKNNPVLVGEPGVGKTAIVQGLAQKIYEGNVPVNLLNKKIYSLDLGLLIAGAIYRGEFEARLKDVILEAESDPNVILFIDEIHTIIGAGSAGGAGSLDAANILKPPLSRGGIVCIGATTLDEYRKHFKKDAALERRFQMVLVEEPSAIDTKKMLKGLKSSYEKHHNLSIQNEAMDAAVELSQRFLCDRFLPDKAFDVIDEAASLVRSRNGGKNYFKEIRSLESKKRGIQTEKEKRVEEEKYDEALLLKEGESEIEEKIKEMYRFQENENKAHGKIPVTPDDVAEIITQMTGVPVKKLVSEEREKLKKIEKIIKQRIVGQDEAVDIISKSIRRSRLGISNENRPMGVFMFLGPTGVGKTELAKVLADVVYSRQDALIKVDMSEFMEKHNVSRLVGAPAGYVGYEEGGKLTEQVRLHPYSIILFDEIEKAHPDVFNLLLQIFEDGQLTDAAGRKVDFKNTVIIMTSNLGTDEMTDEARIGFSENEKLDEKEKKEKIIKKYNETKEEIMKELKEEFRQEFINRIDRIIVFNPLGESDIKSVLKIQFDEFKKRLLKNNGIKISASGKAMDYISKKSFNPNEGARLIRRNIQTFVEDAVSEKIIEGGLKKGDGAKLDIESEKIIVKVM